jgi:uncharacterized membrane protein
MREGILESIGIVILLMALVVQVMTRNYEIVTTILWGYIVYNSFVLRRIRRG